jgi:GH35 family endo-1,4-beta-xylanase
MPTSKLPHIVATPAPRSQDPALTDPAVQFSDPGRGGTLFWLLACVLLAFVQLPWAGYGLGVGNQGIQIAFLETLHNPGLFQNDPMVRETLGAYPSYFFKLLAALRSYISLPTLYLLLHLAATAGVFASVVFLARSIVGRRTGGWVGFLTCLLLLAGHHTALAGETLYSAGFTHTWAVFPLSLCALALFYRGRLLAAFLLTGLIFNFHALEAGHLVLIMGFVALCRLRRVGLKRLVSASLLFMLAALPTLLMMVRTRQTFTPEWLGLMHIRSADHSFPSSWWEPGSVLPQFICILALATLALGFNLRPTARRTTLLIAAAVGGLFVVGTLFTEWHPVPLVIRAQFFRASRLLMILALILIAHGCLSAWRLPWRRPAGVRPWMAWLEFAAAAFIALTLAIPATLVLLPLALAGGLLASILTGRLAWHGALVAGIAIVVCLFAWQTLHFVIPGLPPATFWGPGTIVDWRSGRLPTALGACVLLAAAALWVLSTRPLRNPARTSLTTGSLALVVIAVVALYPTLHTPPAGREDAWADAQRWVRNNTPTTALLLTPAQQSGFRIHSQRSIVGEWRDGTQLYFAGGFAKTWWDRMNALQPGMVVDADGKSLLNPGLLLERMEDPQVIALARQFNATYVVLPHDEAGTRSLEKLYDNGTWAVYRPEVAVVSMGSHSTEMAEEDKFLRETALPNIDKYRKSDVSLQIVDAAGQPLFGAQFRITQTATPFHFGVSLPFFKRPAVDTKFDFKPGTVTDKELTRAADLFNSSVLAFSGQWRFTEPQRGKPDYADLDAYVAWCEKSNLRAEFHPLAGYTPPWFKSLPAPEQTKALLARAAALGKRYDKRIADWQIPTALLGGTDVAIQVFNELRKAAPHARLGIAADARFWTPHAGAQAQAERFAGADDLRRLKDKNIKVDFVALYARRPVGLWAAGDELYAVLDRFAAEKVPIHITELGVPVGGRIEGSVRDGRWTPELQAEYYERLFTVLFSHPSVEAVNLMGIGPTTWLEGQGLLNDKGEHTPAFDALHRLITQKWRTRAAGALGVDGGTTFRGFHGTYGLQLTTPDGKTAATTFTVDPASSNRFRYQLNPTGTLTRQETP